MRWPVILVKERMQGNVLLFFDLSHAHAITMALPIFYISSTVPSNRLNAKL